MEWDPASKETFEQAAEASLGVASSLLDEATTLFQVGRGGVERECVFACVSECFGQRDRCAPTRAPEIQDPSNTQRIFVGM